MATESVKPLTGNQQKSLSKEYVGYTVLSNMHLLYIYIIFTLKNIVVRKCKTELGNGGAHL